MKLVAALAVLVALVAPSLSLSECQWGPSFWCQSHTTAQQCRQVQYCQEKVWKASAKTPMGMTCTICELVAKYLQEFVEKNSTETEAKDAVEDLCSALGPFKSECDDLVNTYFNMIWQLLVNELSPDAICAQIGLCTSVAKPALSAPKAPKDISCDVCQLVAGYLDGLLKENETESEAEEEVEKFCSLLGAFKNECVELVSSYFPLIWQLLVNELSPDAICAQIGLCSSAAKPALSAPKPQVNGAECELCDFVLNIVHSLVEKDSTKEEALEIVEQVCQIMGDMKSLCLDLISSNWDNIWEMVENEIEPGVICPLLVKGCTSQTITPVKQVEAVPPQMMPKQSACDICKLIVSFLKPYVDSNTTEQEVEQALESLCDILPSSLSSECEMLVTTYFPLIWQLVESEFDNDQICNVLGLCTSAVKTAVKAAPPQTMPKQTVCDICKLVVSFLKPYVDSNATEQEVEQALESLCNLLPSSLSSECDAVVNTYFPAIWQLLKSEFDSDQICTLLGLCSNTAVMVEEAPLPPLRKFPKLSPCYFCKLVVNFAEPFVDNATSEAKVKSDLDRVCGLLPSKYAQECQLYVDTYFPIIWALMQEEVSGDEICIQLGFCNSTNTKDVLVKAAPPRSMPKQSLCDICKTVVTFVKPYVDSNVTEQEVKAVLEELCSLLPSNLSSECDTIVDEYLPVIWDLLKQEVDSGELCKMIGLCPSRVAVVAVKSPPPSEKKPKAGVLCIVCEFVMKEIESLLINNATKADIEAALDKVCSLLPSTIRQDCDNFVKEYAPAIIELLLDAVDPKVVCTVLGVCVGDELRTPVSVKGSEECDLCKMAVSYLKTLIEAFNTTKVDDLLDYVCSFMPTTIKNECTEFVNTYGPQLVQLIKEYIGQEIVPQVICQKLGLCSSSVLLHSWTKML